jgi:hypothetical protein
MEKLSLHTGGSCTIPPTAILQNRVALAFVDNVTIMITRVEKWTAQDMYTVMEETGRLGGLIVDPCAFTQYFGATFGADATHRKLIVDWQTANNIPKVKRVVNLTDSVLMRAALTAYLWMAKTDGKAFKPDDLDLACAWITRDLVVKPEDVKAAIVGCYKLLGVPSL